MRVSWRSVVFVQSTPYITWFREWLVHSALNIWVAFSVNLLEKTIQLLLLILWNDNKQNKLAQCQLQRRHGKQIGNRARQSNGNVRTFSISSFSHTSFTRRSQFFSFFLLGDAGSWFIGCCGRLLVESDFVVPSDVRLDHRSPTNFCSTISILTVSILKDALLASISCAKSKFNSRSSPRIEMLFGWMSTKQLRLLAFFTSTSITTFWSVWYQSWRAAHIALDLRKY